MDKRARSHDYLVVISRHIPRIRHDVAVDRRRRLYAANELDKFVFGVEFYASYYIVAFHAGIRQRFVAQIVVNLPKQYASFYGVFDGNRRHKKPLIKRQITAEITSDFVSYRRRRETIRNLADNFGFSRKICACGRDSAACVFDQTADDKVRADVCRFKIIDKLAVTVVDGNDNILIFLPDFADYVGNCVD